MIGWGLRFLRNCGRERWRANTEVVLRLAVYSRAMLDEVTAATGIEYDRGERGNLRVYRDAASLAEAEKTAEIYRSLGQPVELLDSAGCITLEPALGPVSHDLAGGVHYRGDRSGDCLRFTRSLAEHAARLGVSFEYGTTISSFETDGERVRRVATDRGRFAADSFVMACGSYSAPLARGLGMRLPVRPVKGYSATLPVGGWNNAPIMPVVDYHHKIAVTPLGDRIRLAGTAEFTGYDNGPNPRRAAMLLHAFGSLFPHYPNVGLPEHWQGLRPMCPDGRPILGRTRYANLFLNTGHGPLGWTLACGSGKALADLVAGAKPDIDLSGFSLARF